MMPKHRERWGVRVMVALAVVLSSAAMGTAASFAEATGTLVLFGEKPRTQRAGQAPTTVDIAAITSETFPAMRVVDLTTDKEAVEAMVRRADKALAAYPQAVILFVGGSERSAGDDQEKLRSQVVALIRIFTRADVEVFVVPSATFVGADVSAALRLASDDTAVHYVEPGAEILGNPYAVVAEEIGKILAARTRSQQATLAPPAVAAVATPAAVANTSGTVVAKPGATPATIYMVAPPPLKRFDPRETPNARKRLGKLKTPAFEE